MKAVPKPGRLLQQDPASGPENELDSGAGMARRQS